MLRRVELLGGEVAGGRAEDGFDLGHDDFLGVVGTDLLVQQWQHVILRVVADGHVQLELEAVAVEHVEFTQHLLHADGVDRHRVPRPDGVHAFGVDVMAHRAAEETAIEHARFAGPDRNEDAGREIQRQDADQQAGDDHRNLVSVNETPDAEKHPVPPGG